MKDKRQVYRVRKSVSDDDDDDEQQCSSATGFQAVTVNSKVKSYVTTVKDDSDFDEWNEQELKESEDDNCKENVEEKQTIWQKLAAHIESLKSLSEVFEEEGEDDDDEMEDEGYDDEVIDPQSSDDEEVCHSTSVQDPGKGKTVKGNVEDLKKLFSQKKHILESLLQRTAEAGANIENLAASRDVVNLEWHLYQKVKRIMKGARTKKFEENARNIPKTNHETLKKELKFRMKKLRLSSKRCIDKVDEDEKESNDACFYENLAKKMKFDSSNNNKQPCFSPIGIPETNHKTMNEALKMVMNKLRSSCKRRHDEVEEDESLFHKAKDSNDADFYKNLSKKMKLMKINMK